LVIGKMDLEKNKKSLLKDIKLVLDNLLGSKGYKIEKNSFNIKININYNDILKVSKVIKDNDNLKFSQLIDITAVDYPENENRFEMVYIFLSVLKNYRIIIKFDINERAILDSLTAIYPSANWYEREIWDLFGINFKNHPDLRRILTDYGFNGFPLRKDFPLSGNVEVRYDFTSKKVVYEPVKLTQSFRSFDFESPWEGEKQTEKKND
tara:strand:+ start:75 stop:698 length:624 start_codon:yes stop_codon:yes gene_type:complete